LFLLFVSCSLILSFWYFLPLFLTFLLILCHSLLILSPFICLEFCNKHSLEWFFWSVILNTVKSSMIYAALIDGNLNGHCSVVVVYQCFRDPCCLHLPCGILERWYPTATVHSVTTQKTLTWSVTAMKASKLIFDNNANSFWPNFYILSNTFPNPVDVLLLSKFSNVTNLYLSLSYYFTSALFSFLRLNLSVWNFSIISLLIHFLLLRSFKRISAGLIEYPNGWWNPWSSFHCLFSCDVVN